MKLLLVRVLPEGRPFTCGEAGLKLTMKVRDLIKILNADGWRQVRMRGSHRQFRHTSKSGTITVAGNENIDIPAGTLTSILKQAGLK